MRPGGSWRGVCPLLRLGMFQRFLRQCSLGKACVRSPTAIFTTETHNHRGSLRRESRPQVFGETRLCMGLHGETLKTPPHEENVKTDLKSALARNPESHDQPQSHTHTYTQTYTQRETGLLEAGDEAPCGVNAALKHVPKPRRCGCFVQGRKRHVQPMRAKYRATPLGQAKSLKVTV